MERFPTFRRHSFSYGQRKNSDESESLLGGQNDEIHEMEGLHLKKRGGSTSSFNGYKSRDQTMQYDIQPSDTLISLAFKYNIQVAELKRVNKIISDREFFALKKIKIPVQPTSLLTEVLPGDPPPELGLFKNNNGWKVESKESPNKSLFSICVSSEQSGLSGSEADTEGTEGPLSPHVKEGNKQKKRVKKMLKGVDKDLDLIRKKQAEIENWTQATEEIEHQASRGTVSNKNYSSFKPACLCAFVLVASLVMMGGLVTVVSIKHRAVEVGDW